jgi:hypothetical protein
LSVGALMRGTPLGRTADTLVPPAAVSRTADSHLPNMLRT